MKLQYTALLFFLCIHLVHSQYIVQVFPDQVEAFDQRIASDDELILKDVLDAKEHIYLLMASESIGELRTWPEIEAVEMDYPLDQRMTPNDPFYNEQNGLRLIKMPLVWENVSTAVDFNGNDLIIAVLDDGFQMDHPDLANSIYINDQEIPDNGIDDDENGLIDDYRGWNVGTNSGVHPPLSHGTGVAGIIGAETDNTTGVSGVVWDAKLFPISGVRNKCHIIKAFGVLRDLKKNYLESNGREGLNVVVNNYSGGVANQFPIEGEKNIMWCRKYDEMGELGILSVGATVNANQDIGITGDMPSLCTSPYLMIATNVNANGSKVSGAGYNKESVDLGSPGSGIITTDVNSTYAEFSGTSAAAPHLAGVVALMFAVPCAAFADQLLAAPGTEEMHRNAALQVKKAIMNTTVPHPSLENITVTGGYLNAWAALDFMRVECGGSSGDLMVGDIKPLGSFDRMQVNYQSPSLEPLDYFVSDAMGRKLLSGTFTPPFVGEKFFVLDTSPLASGIYFISIYNDNEIKSSKFDKP